MIQVPLYLHDKILALPAEETTPCLGQFHKALSKNRDSEKILDRCVWVHTSKGRTCTFNDERSTAQNLDVFQEGFSRTASDRSLTICAINPNVGGDIEPYEPWYTSIIVSPTTHLPSTISPAKHFRAIVDVILKDKWPGCDLTTVTLMQQLKERSPPQLTWDLSLPSKACWAGPESLKAPAQDNLDITLEWPRERHASDTFLGCYDWSIYIWEPYSERPVLDILRLKDVTILGSEHHRMLMVTNSGSALRNLKSRHDQAATDMLIDTSSSAEDQMLDSLLISIEMIITDGSDYISNSVELVHKVARRSTPGSQVATKAKTDKVVGFGLSKQPVPIKGAVPTSSARVPRLGHESLPQQCEFNLRSLPTLPPSTPAPHGKGPSQAESLLWTYRRLEVLSGRARETCQSYRKAEGNITDQIELFDKRRNRTIGMFIAIYVPLAFATVRHYQHS